MKKRKVPELYYRSSRIFRVLGNPTAYQIVRLLGTGSKSPTEIAQSLQLSVPTISESLRNLRQLDLVRYENHRAGKLYAVKDDALHNVLDTAERLVKRIRTRDY
jgi:DNA-binding transcriptional ArsR family regulator